MSARRSLGAVVLVVLLLAGAGCSSFTGGPDGTATDGDTEPTETGGDTEPTGADDDPQPTEAGDSTTVQADIVGLTADGVAVEPGQTVQTEAAIANRLGVDPIDVTVRPNERGQNGTVEVFDETVTRDEFRTALQAEGYQPSTARTAEGYQPSTVRTGVTDATREELVAVVRERLRLAGLDGGTVEASGQVLTVTVPDENESAVTDALTERGVVRVYAVYRNDSTGNWTHQQVLSQDEFASIGNARTSNNIPQVPVVIEQSAAEEFQNEMAAAGFGDGATCGTDAAAHDTVETINSTCLVTTLDGEPVFIGGVEPSLGNAFADGTFADDPSFVMTTTSMEEARDLELSLRAGRLPANLSFERDS